MSRSRLNSPISPEADSPSACPSPADEARRWVLRQRVLVTVNRVVLNRCWLHEGQLIAYSRHTYTNYESLVRRLRLSRIPYQGQAHRLLRTAVNRLVLRALEALRRTPGLECSYAAGRLQDLLSGQHLGGARV